MATHIFDPPQGQPATVAVVKGCGSEFSKNDTQLYISLDPKYESDIAAATDRLTDYINEVLKHIYRAIASRHLPFEGITMVHLDSHPDLQIPSKMPAQVVYKLDELSNYLSIENWIVPAVYSGHISRLVWMKPPWADQLPEGSRQITLGQHKEHGTIRIDWPDEYYISDVVFATRDDMVHSRQLDLDIVTLNYEVSHKYSKLQTEEDLTLLVDSVERTKNPSDEQSLGVRGVSESSRTQTSEEVPLEARIPNASQQQRSMNTVRDIHSQGDGGKQDICEAAGHGGDNGNMQVGGTLIEPTVSTDAISVSKGSSGRSLHLTSAEQRDVLPSMNRNVTDAVGNAIRGGEAFILDIDLDFFSTQNPFKLDYCPEQLAVLKELYKFDAPKDESIEEINRAQGERSKQLDDLQEAIRWSLKEDSCTSEVQSQRWHKVKRFTDGLRESGKTSLDAELIHMAGETTCDDDEDLPHHVSSEQEIRELIRRVKEVLSGQPKPVMVTIARSSEDDYCPKSQVDSIQEQVLSMLGELYGDMEVKLDYEKAGEEP